MAKKIDSTEPTFELGQDVTIRDAAQPNSILSGTAPGVDDPANFNLDDYVGYTWDGKPIVDLDGVIDHLDSGSSDAVNGNVITYSFTDLSHLTGIYNNPKYGFGAPNGFSAFNADQQAEAREAVQLWDDLIAPTFVEKNGLGADIQFGNSADPAQAYAYYPGNGVKVSSDVFVADPALNGSNAWLGLNGYGATTLVHELGHTIGLSHPGNYNYDPDLDLTYGNYAEYAQDSEQYTIMSYWDATATGSYIIDWSTFFFGNEQTPLLHDILTIQDKYGADPTTRAGDTVYGFNSNAGNEVYDFAVNPFPYLSINDAGGTDTIDLSGFNAGVYLDLHAGSFSSAAQAVPDAATVNASRDALSAVAPDYFGTLSHLTQAQINATSASYIAYNASSVAADTGVSGVGATETNNLSIAYGTTIENGTGGSARDVIWGNQVDNVLKGMGGNDVLNGFEGNDTLQGGAGADTFQFHNLETGDTIGDFATGVDHIDVSAFGFTAWLGDSDFTGNAGELRFDDSVLSGDLNGDGVADFAVTVYGSDVHIGDLIA
jgi:serralysin